MNESLYGTDKERGFKRIYDLYADNVYRLCFSYMKNKMDAEDIMQETFIKFYQRRQVFSRNEEAKAWLLVTASNQCKNALKHWWRKHRDIDDWGWCYGDLNASTRFGKKFTKLSKREREQYLKEHGTLIPDSVQTLKPDKDYYYSYKWKREYSWSRRCSGCFAFYIQFNETLIYKQQGIGYNTICPV